MHAASKKAVVFTLEAECRDCYRCIRVCPVNAIGMRDGQAFVDPDRCMACGTCVRECPQGAKQVRSDWRTVKDWLAQGEHVAVSLAPSWVVLYPDWRIGRLASALRQLGFRYVAETAIGAHGVAYATREVAEKNPQQHCLSSACPAVVRYLLQVCPQHKHTLAPVLSPMLAHGRMIKDKLGTDCRVVFIGPCVAKKAEAQDDPIGLIDAVLTFNELNEWLEHDQIDLSQLEESAFDEPAPGPARSFALPSGSGHAAGVESGELDGRLLCVSGAEDVQDLLDSLDSLPGGVWAEPLFCRQGCINGPAVGTDRPLQQRRRDILDYSQSMEASPPPPSATLERFKAEMPTPSWVAPEVSEQEIRDILGRTGKEAEADQLNCGACGYRTCRDQAIAVSQGMAETDMCVPFMRRLAAQRMDRIVETSPNGIVILDEHLHILHMNPSFKKLFMCSDTLLGKGISKLLDPQPFNEVATGVCRQREVTARHATYGLTTHQVIYSLPEENQVVGIFVNLTASLANKQRLNDLRRQTLRQARDLLDHQIRMAGDIARTLGQSTAESEVLLRSLMTLAGEDPDDLMQEDDPWSDPTSTSR